MVNIINISQIVSKNCGGYGAWIDNPLSSPAPGAGLWRGFQLGGGGGGGGRRRGRRGRSGRSGRSGRRRKSRKNKKRRQIKTRRH